MPLWNGVSSSSAEGTSIPVPLQDRSQIGVRQVTVHRAAAKIFVDEGFGIVGQRILRVCRDFEPPVAIADVERAAIREVTLPL
jgi:hypothetical protein